MLIFNNNEQKKLYNNNNFIYIKENFLKNININKISNFRVLTKKYLHNQAELRNLNMFNKLNIKIPCKKT